MKSVTVIKVTLTHIYSNRRGSRVPFKNYYECAGPDGRRFTNSDKSTLKQVLTRRYGPVKLEVDDQRKPINDY